MHTVPPWLYKVAIMGPESTGKSSMSMALADHYHTAWVPEYAREYCTALQRPATLTDEVAILRGQIELEERIMKTANRLLICDTMFLTVKIYSEHVFKTYPREIDQLILLRRYDLFLIMDIDLAWQDDPLREFPQLRPYFMARHIEEIKRTGRPFEIISGQGQARVKEAQRVIDLFLD